MSVVVLRGDAASLPLPDASVDLIVTSPPYFGLRSYSDGGEHYAGQIREPQTLTGGGDMARRAAVSSNGGRNHRDFGSAKADYNPLGKLPGSVWEIASQPLAVPSQLGVDHFAAFPMELPRRVILGWSPSGICTECGEGRRPVAEADPVKVKGWALGQVGGRGWHGDGSEPTRALGATAADRNRRITGYACACPQPDAPARPAVVLDPFGGTGTTALVAAVHGRTGVSVDRSADYCRLARWRTSDPAERARAMCVPKPPPVIDGQVSLFDGLD